MRLDRSEIVPNTVHARYSLEITAIAHPDAEWPQDASQAVSRRVLQASLSL